MRVRVTTPTAGVIAVEHDLVKSAGHVLHVLGANNEQILTLVGKSTNMAVNKKDIRLLVSMVSAIGVG